MAQTPETLFDSAPCPDCDSTHLIQHTTQSNDLYVTEDGDIQHIEPRDSTEVQELWCPECDEKLWERESSSIRLDNDGDYQNIIHDGELIVSISEYYDELLVYESGKEGPVGAFSLSGEE